MQRRIVTALVTLTLAGGTASPAFATHIHRIETPGTCVDRHGQGWGEGEEHLPGSFHDEFHTGRVGAHAFGQERNPVSIQGGGLCS